MKEWKDEDTGLIWQVEKSENHDMNSAEEFEDEHEGWRIPTTGEWETLVKFDSTFKDSVPFKDKDVYWTSSLYRHNPEQKMMLADFSHDRLDLAFTSRTNFKSVRLVKG